MVNDQRAQLTPKKPSPPSLTSSASSVGTGPLSGGSFRTGVVVLIIRFETARAGAIGRLDILVAFLMAIIVFVKLIL